jgi:CheY-like chemotaxis protein
MISVLIVEDEPDVQRILSRVLRRAGVETIQASSGLSALQILSHRSVDVILSDLHMPGISGIELYQRLPGALQRRVIFCSGSPPTEELPAEVPLLWKPVDTLELREMVAQIAARALVPGG